MRGLENTLFIREELDRAKRELFMVNNVRAMRMMQDRISFLSQQLRQLNGRIRK